MILILPYAAKCNAVFPSLFLTFKFAPYSNNTFIAFALYYLAAHINGLLPSLSSKSSIITNTNIEKTDDVISNKEQTNRNTK